MGSSHWRWLILWALGTAAAVAWADDDPCAGFAWDVSGEQALFATWPQAAVAGEDAVSAPLLVADHLYELALVPQEQVKFAAPPGKKARVDGASAGLARLHLAGAGDYRISLDRPFWIDVVADQQLIAAADFQGRPGCQKPHKIVLYSLPGGQDLVLQLSGAVGNRVRLTITRVAAGPAR
jgi:hypothetical protein